MTKKNIWVKLLIVALIIAMVGVFFIACNKDEGTTDDGGKTCTKHVDTNGDGKCDNCGTTMPKEECTEHVDADGDGYCDKCGEEMPIDDTAVKELIGVIDDLVASAGGIENVGNLGTDAELVLAIEQDGKTKKIKIELDLALDLLNTSAYGNNGFGAAISVDNGDGKYNRVFGIWYLNGETDADSSVYLEINNTGLVIDALTVAKVLEKYNVNANVPVGDKVGDTVVSDAIGSYIGTIATMVKLDYTDVNGVKTFKLNVKDLLNPDGMIATLLNSAIFKEEGSLLENLAGINVSKILKDLNIAIADTEDLYNILPDFSVVVKGEYDNNNFAGISLGLEVAGSESGVSIPRIDTEKNDPIVIAPAFSDTNLSATLKAQFLTNDEAFGNVESLYSAVATEAEEEQWADIGVLNFAFDAQVTLGTTKETAKTYDIQVAADINAAAIANATFTKRVYYTDANGDYVKGADGNYLYTDWFYLKGASIFGNSQDTDVIRALLPAINSFYLKMVNVEDPADVLIINLAEKFTTNAAGDINGGSLYVKLAALNNIMSTFGLDLEELLGDLSGTIMGMNGDVPYQTVNAALGMLPGMLYKIPEDYAALGATEMTMTAPAAMASATTDEATDGEGSGEATDGEGSGATGGTDIKEIFSKIFEVIDKIKASVTMGTDSITAANAKDVDYTIGGAAITFDMTGSVLRNDAKEVDGIKVVTNKPFVANYNDGEVVTSIGANVQIGHGELFTAEVTVNQDKAGVDALDVYIDFTLEKIGYGCAVRTPVQLDGENPVGSIYREGAGFVASK